MKCVKEKGEPSCEKVKDLKTCFDQLFETVSDTPLRLQLFNGDENIAVGKMIGDIYAGRLTLQLSSKQSLELLIDLGIQKIKKNYFFILESCGFVMGEQLQQNWNELGFAVAESRRGTFTELNLSTSCLQLRHLLCIHILLEFLQLVEQNCCCSNDVKMSVMKHAYNKYVTEKTSEELFSVIEQKLCDLVVPLSFNDVKLIEGCSPMKWQMKMTSADKHSAVTTLFHFSKKCIFPDVIYTPPNSALEVAHEKLYVSRLESYRDSIFSN